jgi:fluoroquinolone transport system permease protein
MKKYLIMLGADFKNMGRDPLLFLPSAAPLLILLLMRVGVPYLNRLLITYTAIDISAYYPFLVLFFSLMPAMLWGLTTAFLCLDENDNRISTYLFITPLRRTGYLVYRISFPVLFSFLFTLLLTAANGLVVFPVLMIFIFSLFSSCLGLFFFLALTVFAHNKVEGLALGKALGVILLGPVAAGLLPAPLKYIGGILPPFWPVEYMLTTGNGSAAFYRLITIGIALCLHAIPIAYLFRRYLRKLE